jgi:hypothetical protein
MENRSMGHLSESAQLIHYTMSPAQPASTSGGRKKKKKAPKSPKPHLSPPRSPDHPAVDRLGRPNRAAAHGGPLSRLCSSLLPRQRCASSLSLCLTRRTGQGSLSDPTSRSFSVDEFSVDKYGVSSVSSFLFFVVRITSFL